MDKVIKRYKLPKLTPEEIESLSSSFPVKEIGVVVKRLPTQKIAGPDGFNNV